MNKAQSAFNRLLGEIERLERKLGEWHEFEVTHQKRVATDLVPLIRQIGDERCRLILLCAAILDGEHDGHKVKNTERRRLAELLLDLCHVYFDDVDEAASEVIAVYDRFAERSWSDEQHEQMATLRDEAYELFGMELPEDADDMASFEAAFKAMAEEHEETLEDSTNRPGKQDSKTGAAASDIKQALREIFRKLASALHPDRGNDEDRPRRHELMQRANEAYERSDLVELLKLQLDADQIDEGHLAAVSQTTLQDYNRVLRQQSSCLKAELEEIDSRFRMVMIDAPRTLSPEVVVADFDVALRQAEQARDQLRSDFDKLQVPSKRRVLLREYEQEKRDFEQVELDDLEVLLFGDDGLLDEMTPFFEPPSKTRKRATKTRRRKKPGRK
ncbi:MAG: J domain-containing protein [Proteobacteria bacterium]|nr:J domain-containing protein [Pseudomonadota bacterium]